VHNVCQLAESEARAVTATAKVSEGTNRNLPAENTLVQLLALFTDPKSHHAQSYRQTDRRTTWCCQL